MVGGGWSQVVAGDDDGGRRSSVLWPGVAVSEGRDVQYVCTCRGTAEADAVWTDRYVCM